MSIPTTPNGSPLRHRLCSRANADLVACRLHEYGISAEVVMGREPLQPWRVIEHDVDIKQETSACA